MSPNSTEKDTPGEDTVTSDSSPDVHKKHRVLKNKEIVYVSWGGTGRGVALRAAIQRIHEEGGVLTYLAILDGRAFSGLDDQMSSAVHSELTWLLEAQIRMIRNQLGYPELVSNVLVRNGDVEDEIGIYVEEHDIDLVLLGAPVPAESRTEKHALGLDDMVSDLIRDTNAHVEVVGL